MLGQHRFQEVVDLFIDQIKGLVDGGSDVLIIETVQDILELKAAIHAAIRVREETGVYVPLQASITLDTSGRMLLGTDIAAALNIMEHMPVDIIGLNCSTGPDYMREPARYLGEYSTRPFRLFRTPGFRSMSMDSPFSRWSRSRWRAVCGRWSRSSRSASSAVAAARPRSTSSKCPGKSKRGRVIGAPDQARCRKSRA